MHINTTISTFMKVAITAVVISAFIFGAMYLSMDGISNTIADYISNSG